MPDSAPTVQQTAVSFIQAMFDKLPASARRAGAAVAALAVPYLNALSVNKLGFGVDSNQVIAMESVLGIYITQSFFNTVHDRATDAKLTIAAVNSLPAVEAPAADPAPGAP